MMGVPARQGGAVASGGPLILLCGVAGEAVGSSQLWRFAEGLADSDGVCGKIAGRVS